jgi:hypothetical protein
MADNYAEGTGVLVLKKITPVIEALFGGFDLGSAPNEEGEVYLAKNDESGCSWEFIGEQLKSLVEQLKLSLPEDAEDEIEEYLYALASHFKQDGNCELWNFIENCDFEITDPDFEQLFDLSQAFDDGHGLTAIRFETAVTCSKPRLFEFGGYGEFYGKCFRQTSPSHLAPSWGKTINSALEANDLDQAAAILTRYVRGFFLDGVTDENLRKQLRQRVAANLAAS